MFRNDAIKIDSWRPRRAGFIKALGSPRADTLDKLNRGFDPDRRAVVFLTFENRYAPLGGLAAVMRYLPASLKKYGEDVTLLTPLYTNIPAVKSALESGELREVFAGKKIDLMHDDSDSDVNSNNSINSNIDNNNVNENNVNNNDVNSNIDNDNINTNNVNTKNILTLSCYLGLSDPVPSYYIGVGGRFTASQNPYSYANSGDILDDSLAFCAAVPFVLSEIGVTENILFHAHDWETAPVAVTSKLAMLRGVLASARTVLTLHNSFDSGIGAARKKTYLGNCAVGDTVLQASVPLLDGPLTTVSAPFAAELLRDPLQRTVFTSHLQGCFAANPPVGIENGMFGRPRLPYTYTALARARQGECSALLRQKARFREKMLETAAAMDHPGVIGGLKGVTDDMPILFMSGRLDLMQKGFDVIFRAIEAIPTKKVGLIFCPSSADGKRHAEALDFFRKIAEEREGDMVIWPFRISAEEYVSVISGSSFLLMPSFYEPFGAATEGFMRGTPVIARATGGLLAQIRPLRAGGMDDGGATGILYHETDGGDGCDHRNHIINNDYNNHNNHNNNDHTIHNNRSDRTGEEWRRILEVPVADRISVPLYQSMVSAARGALLLAAEVFSDAPAYGGMMVNGMDRLRGFSWDAAVRKYRRVYDTASRRGFFDS